MWVILGGRVMLTRFLHQSNVLSPISVILAGMAMLTMPLPEKASSPIRVTLEGMVILLRPQPENAESSIKITLSGIVYVVPSFPRGYLISIVLFLLNKTPPALEYERFRSSTAILARFQHAVKFLSMWLMLAGIRTSVNS